MLEFLTGLPWAVINGLGSAVAAFLGWLLGLLPNVFGASAWDFYVAYVRGSVRGLSGLLDIVFDVQTVMSAGLVVLGLFFVAVGVRMTLWTYHQFWGSS